LTQVTPIALLKRRHVNVLQRNREVIGLNDWRLHQHTCVDSIAMSRWHDRLQRRESTRHVRVRQETRPVIPSEFRNAV